VPAQATSFVWKHASLYQGTDNLWYVACLLCTKNLFRFAYDGGTSNIIGHLESVHKIGKPKPQPQQTLPQMADNSYSGLADRAVLQFVYGTCAPLSIVTNPYFVNMCAALGHKYRPPGAAAIRSGLEKACAVVLANVRRLTE
jgi:hypothetical protein